MSKQNRQAVVAVDPPFARALFGDARWAWLWLIARVYVGYTWLSAGIAKLHEPGWVQTGASLKGFWTKAVAIPAAPARPAISIGWYRAFLQTMLDAGAYTWFSKLVIAGEILIGAALILGIFTGVAALFGGFMNWNFLMAGTVSSNPVLLLLAILIVLAWKTAGWWGLDRWALSLVGTPWHPGRIFRRKAEATGAA